MTRVVIVTRRLIEEVQLQKHELHKQLHKHMELPCVYVIVYVTINTMTSWAHVTATRISYAYEKILYLTIHSAPITRWHIFIVLKALHNNYTMKRPIFERSDGINYTALNLPAIEMK